MSEYSEQAALVNYLYMQYPGLLFWSVPNGAHLAGSPGQRAAQMNALKATGFLPGVSDLIIFEPRGNYAALFCEMKDVKGQGGKPTESQLEFLEEVAKRNAYGFVAYGFDEAKALIDEYLSW